MSVNGNICLQWFAVKMRRKYRRAKGYGATKRNQEEQGPTIGGLYSCTFIELFYSLHPGLSHGFKIFG